MSESEKLWIEFAKAALSGISSSVPIGNIYNINPALFIDLSNIAAAIADKMMNEYMGRFRGQPTRR